MVKGELLVQKRPKQGEALQCIAASKSGKRCTARVHARVVEFELFGLFFWIQY